MEEANSGNIATHNKNITTGQSLSVAEALIKNEQEKATVLDRINDSIVSLDNNWCYTFLNNAALATHPLGLAETLGKSIWDVHPMLKNTIFWHKYREAMASKQHLAFESYYAPMAAWFSVRVFPTADGLTIVYSDITQYKKAEHELLRQKNLSESIINSLPGIFYLYDHTGKFLQWNKNFETVSGYTGDEISRMHPLDFFHPDEKELLTKVIANVFKTGAGEVEAHIFTKAKLKIPYYFNGSTIQIDGVDCLMGMGIDIADSTRMKNVLKESEEKYRYLFNNNPALIIIWDIESLAIVEVNDIAIEQYGYTRDEFLTMDVLKLRPEEDRSLIKDFAQKMLLGAEEKKRKVWRHLKKNGELMYMDITSHRIDYNNRKAILSLAKDITEQIAAEKRLQESYEDIRRLNAYLQTVREEERTSIAREIHDELGQLLTGLKMDTSWLMKKTSPSENVQLEKLGDMMALIDETVKTVRRISSDLRPGILDDLGLIAALEWQSGEFEKRTGIPCTFISDLGDAGLKRDMQIGVFRVYQEALTNVMRHAHATKVTTTVQQTADNFILKVQDDGQGFDMQEAKSKKTLGLIGMAERALMFGGHLYIDSEKEKGTTVVLRIPLF
jgi:PAS domain S-box-containing protein